MRRLLVGVVLGAVLALGCSVAAASASAGSVSPVTKQDTASTKAFIALQERYGVGVIRLAPAINAAEGAFVAQIRAGCPGVLARLPHKLSHQQSSALQKFLPESALAFLIDVSAPLRRLTNRIAAQQQRLRFSDPALQWQVRVTGAASAALFALRPPNLCTDGQLLASSMFNRITPAGARFVHDALTLDKSAGISASSLVRRMRSYAPTAAATALKRLRELNRTLNHKKLALDRHYRAVLRALGVTDGTMIAADAARAAPQVTKQDTVSTKAFIASAERYDRLEVARIPAINARQDAYVAQVSAACPAALAGAPARRTDSQQVALLKFRTELGAALEIDALQPVRAVTDRIAVVQERLRFSDPFVQFEVGFYASATSAYLALRPPDLCADARALAASGFTKLTPAGNAFWHDLSTLLYPASLPSAKLLPRMRAYAPRAVAAALKRLPVLQRRFDQPLHLDRHANAIMNALSH